MIDLLRNRYPEHDSRCALSASSDWNRLRREELLVLNGELEPAPLERLDGSTFEVLV